MNLSSGMGFLGVLIVLSGCGGKKSPAATNDPSAGAAGGNPLMAPVDYLGAQAQAKRVATKTISMAELTQAIQKFNAMEDRFPTSLQELVQQHYLQTIPVAPTGFRFAYNPQTGDVRVVRQ